MIVFSIELDKIDAYGTTNSSVGWRCSGEREERNGGTASQKAGEAGTEPLLP